MGEKVKAKKKKRESCYFLIDSHEKEVLQFSDEQALGDTVESWLNEGDINLIALDTGEKSLILMLIRSLLSLGAVIPLARG